jgi:hypothetical protein
MLAAAARLTSALLLSARVVHSRAVYTKKQKKEQPVVGSSQTVLPAHATSVGVALAMAW